MRRHHQRFPLVLVPVLCAAVFLVWLFIPHTQSPYGRETFIIVSDPMVVASWSASDKSLTLISIPADVATDGTHGYGTYSLAAFWRLGEIDKKDGTVLSESMSEALGIPVEGYIGPKSGLIGSQQDTLSTVKSTFSFGHIAGIILGEYRTNIPLTRFISFAWLLHFSRPDRVNTFDFTDNTAAIAQTVILPDGSDEVYLDTERVDSQLKSVFEDDSVRLESVTAAVYNTTNMPSLGTRVARLLANLGVSVVTVGNDIPEVGTCTVAGREDALKSKSAQVIISVLGCKPVVKAENRADLIIRIGSSYAKRFLPN